MPAVFGKVKTCKNDPIQLLRSHRSEKVLQEVWTTFMGIFHGGTIYRTLWYLGLYMGYSEFERQFSWGTMMINNRIVRFWYGQIKATKSYQVISVSFHSFVFWYIHLWLTLSLSLSLSLALFLSLSLSLLLNKYTHLYIHTSTDR